MLVSVFSGYEIPLNLKQILHCSLINPCLHLATDNSLSVPKHA